MNRLVTVLVIGIATMAMPRVVNAAASVFFEVLEFNGNPLTGYPQPGPGEAFVAALPGNGSLTVAMKATITEVSLYSVNTTLRVEGGNAQFSNWNPSPPADGAGIFPLFPAEGNIIAAHFGAATFSGPGYFGDDVLLGTFTLNFNRTPGEALNITAEVGNILWAQSDAQPASVRFGKGQFVDGATIGAGGDLVISIVPEPASVFILGVGACLSLRRRRSAS